MRHKVEKRQCRGQARPEQSTYLDRERLNSVAEGDGDSVTALQIEQST
jgi:hypothetical protein